MAPASNFQRDSRALNSSFDPFTQSFSLLMPNGRVPMQTSLQAVDSFVSVIIQATIVQAVQIGLVAMLTVVLLVMTKPEKRRSLVFIINTLALVIIFFRGVVDLLVIQGPLYNFYRWISGAYIDLGNAPLVSCVDQVLAFLSTFAIELALVTQVRIVCCTLSTFQRIAVNGANIAAAMVACVCHFSLGVLNIRWNILGVDSEQHWQFDTIGRLDSATYIAITISIGLSSLIFNIKLALAIRKRRSIGMTQFGAMQIIFVGGCQTMVLPFIFTVISYFAFPYANLQTFVQTCVAILLPLSGMWAATATTPQVSASSAPCKPKSRVVPIGYSSDSKPGPFDGSPQSYYAHTCSQLIRGDDSPTRPSTLNQTSCEANDLEMQRASGVVVDRTFSVLSG